MLTPAPLRKQHRPHTPGRGEAHVCEKGSRRVGTGHVHVVVQELPHFRHVVVLGCIAQLRGKGGHGISTMRQTVEWARGEWTCGYRGAWAARAEAHGGKAEPDFPGAGSPPPQQFLQVCSCPSGRSFGRPSGASSRLRMVRVMGLSSALSLSLTLSLPLPEAQTLSPNPFPKP